MAARRNASNKKKSLDRVSELQEQILHILGTVSYEAISNSFKIDNVSYPNETHSMEEVVYVLGEFRNTYKTMDQAVERILETIDKYNLMTLKVPETIAEASEVIEKEAIVNVIEAEEELPVIF